MYHRRGRGRRRGATNAAAAAGNDGDQALKSRSTIIAPWLPIPVAVSRRYSPAMNVSTTGAGAAGEVLDVAAGVDLDQVHCLHLGSRPQAQTASRSSQALSPSGEVAAVPMAHG